jgi:hypothetical protein
MGPKAPYFIILLCLMQDDYYLSRGESTVVEPKSTATQWVNGPITVPNVFNEQNFDLDQSRQKFHHNLKKHHKISNIYSPAKFAVFCHFVLRTGN